MNPVDQREETKYFLEEVLTGTPGSEIFIDEATTRVTKDDGGQKYYDAASDTMLFEKLHADKLFEYVEEEILDVANYAYMLHNRARLDSEKALAQGLVQSACGIFWSIRVARERAQELDRSISVLDPTAAHGWVAAEQEMVKAFTEPAVTVTLPDAPHDGVEPVTGVTVPPTPPMPEMDCG